MTTMCMSNTMTQSATHPWAQVRVERVGQLGGAGCDERHEQGVEEMRHRR